MPTKRKVRRRLARACDGLLVRYNEMLLDGKPETARMNISVRAAALNVKTDWLLRYIKYKAK